MKLYINCLLIFLIVDATAAQDYQPGFIQNNPYTANSISGEKYSGNSPLTGATYPTTFPEINGLTIFPEEVCTMNTGLVNKSRLSLVVSCITVAHLGSMAYLQFIWYKDRKLNATGNFCCHLISISPKYPPGTRILRNC